MSNRRAVRTALILIPAALTLGLVVASWLRQAQAPLSAPPDEALLASGMRIDASFAGLIDPQGRAVEEARFAGRHRLVSFGFTSCPDVCPMTLLGVRTALETLGPQAEELVPVFVSVDPERDTPERVGAYVAAFDSRIVGLTGPPEALARLARQYRVHYAKRALGEGEGAYTMDHTALVYLIDPEQRIRALIPASDGPQRLAEEIVQAYRAVRS